ncbi:MAG: hypothetical protein M1814_002355 [Vezdaea aestivalis]|nr:MAG: hypothetical protein M1814_002355 [Vezdaea aestivalis]
MAFPTSNALTKRARDNELMPPPLLAKRIKRPAKVLDEDVYADALAQIIARDFFPGIEEARSQLRLLDALESRDREWIMDASRQLSSIMTPIAPGARRRLATPSRVQDTPTSFFGDTPRSVASTVAETSSKGGEDQVDINMSLDAFVARYTSEDNESFYKVMDKWNEKKAKRYAWLRSGDNKIAAPRQIAYRDQQRKLIELRNQETTANGGTEVMRIENEDNRPAMPDTWKAKPNNELMFIPDGVEDNIETVQQLAELNSKAPPKAVVYGNTRLPTEQPVSGLKAPGSPTLSAIQDAIDGRPRRSDSESIVSGSETPRVNGYGFVDPDPTPEPEELPTLHSLFGNADSTPSPFKLGVVSKREKLHNKMVDKIIKGRRGPEANSHIYCSPLPRSLNSPHTTAVLSPAGQSLLSKVGTPKNGRKGAFDKAAGIKKPEPSLKLRSTPTPLVKHKS